MTNNSPERKPTHLARTTHSARHVCLLAKKVLGSTEYPDSVMTTWQLTMEHFADHPLSRAILRLASFYGAEPIPYPLFEKSISDVQHAAAKLAPDGMVLEPIDDAVMELADYSMVETDGHCFTVHALVQTVQRLEIPAAEKKTWLEAALSVVNDHTPTNPEDVRIWPPLEPHIAVVVQHAVEMQISNPTTRLMNVHGMFLKSKGLYADAEEVYRRAIVIEGAAFGTKHPNVAICLNNLAQLLEVTNRLEEAEPLMQRALAIDQAAYGLVHPDVASDLNNLATLYKATNRLAKAEPLMRRALAIDEAAFGPDHPLVARDLNNLALLLKATKRLEEAEPLMQRTVQIFFLCSEKTGHEHPHLQASLSSYTALLSKMGLGDQEIIQKLQELGLEIG